MVTHLQRPHIGIVGGKILNAHGRVVNAGYNYNRSKNRLIKTQVGARGNKMGMYYRLMSSTYIFATDEDCLMVSRKDFDKVGGMDKNAPPFIRGIELCIKIAQLGLRVLFIPQASFYQPYPQEDTEELVLSGPLKKYAVDAYTNPSLLEALADTKLNLLYGVGFNKEVGEDGALYWSKTPGFLKDLLGRDRKSVV